VNDKTTSRPIDCYADGERGFMDLTRRVRERASRPLLGALSRAGVRADHLTLLSLVSGVGFAALWVTGLHITALASLVLHIVLDGLDGPLARFQNRASSRGSFTDTASDQLVVAASAFALLYTGTTAGVVTAIYVFVYTVVVCLAVARNALQIPYSWLVRPRLVVYAYIPVEVWLLPDTMDVVLWGSSALLFLKLATGFVRVRRRLG
jgi:phosphatidylglycerophosphate synthase